MKEPIAAAEAIADPETAPNSIAETILTNANPPGNPPTIVFAKSIKRLAIPPVAMMLPERIKNGIANKVKLSNAVAICCETVLIAGVNPVPITNTNVVGIPIQNAIGTFNNSSVIKLKININTSILISKPLIN